MIGFENKAMQLNKTDEQKALHSNIEANRNSGTFKIHWLLTVNMWPGFEEGICRVSHTDGVCLSCLLETPTLVKVNCRAF